MTSVEDQTDLTAVVDELVEAYNSKDFDRLEQLLTPDVHFRHHNRGFGFDDRQSLVGLVRMAAAELIPDRKFGPPTRQVQAGNVVVREHPWSGTAIGDLPGLAAKGETLNLDLCTVFVFEGDRISEYHDYG